MNKALQDRKKNANVVSEGIAIIILSP